MPGKADGATVQIPEPIWRVAKRILEPSFSTLPSWELRVTGAYLRLRSGEVVRVSVDERGSVLLQDRPDGRDAVVEPNFSSDEIVAVVMQKRRTWIEWLQNSEREWVDIAEVRE